MCLLARVESWTQDRIVCHADSHLAADNPLRKDNRLSMVCGCEYGFQAAALHGALVSSGVAQPAGFLAGLRVSRMAAPYLDDPAIGTLRVEAVREASQASGLVYGFRLQAEDGRLLLEGRGTIALPAG
jgi:predicted hotdog family 3-hydroxylacyl-ACP dehydratase